LVVLWLLLLAVECKHVVWLWRWRRWWLIVVPFCCIAWVIVL
jgi:hypothetical protein